MKYDESITWNIQKFMDLLMNIYVPAKIFADQKVVIKHVSTWIYLNRAFLYADYGMAASMDPIWLQGGVQNPDWVV